MATLPATRQRKRAPEALIRASYPGVYRRGRRYVAVYLRGGRQRKETVSRFAEARAVKVARQAEARAERLGPTLRAHALRWVDCHAGLGHDTVGERTRREHRRLLATFAFRYFPPDTRLAEVDREALQGFVTWLVAYRGKRGRLSDRSIANVLVPFRLCLADAEREGLVRGGPAKAPLLQRRRGGNGWHFEQGRFLTREQLGRALAEIPDEWSPFFELLASTGLRVSEAIALGWMDLDVSNNACLWVRRSIGGGLIGRRSRVWTRCIPLDPAVAVRLTGRRDPGTGEEDLVSRAGEAPRSTPDNIRYRILTPAVERAGLPGVGFHAFRHTCASMLVERGLSPLRLQRWMGHHSAACTLDTYGHLIDEQLASPLDLKRRVAWRLIASVPWIASSDGLCRNMWVGWSGLWGLVFPTLSIE